MSRRQFLLLFSHFSSSLVIILQFQIQHVAIFEPKRQAIIRSHRNSIFPFAITFQWMKAKSRKIQITKFPRAL